jgi:hypothetical protein
VLYGWYYSRREGGGIRERLTSVAEQGGERSEPDVQSNPKDRSLNLLYFPARHNTVMD